VGGGGVGGRVGTDLHMPNPAGPPTRLPSQTLRPRTDLGVQKKKKRRGKNVKRLEGPSFAVA